MENNIDNKLIEHVLNEWWKYLISFILGFALCLGSTYIILKAFGFDKRFNDFLTGMEKLKEHNQQTFEKSIILWNQKYNKNVKQTKNRKRK